MSGTLEYVTGDLLEADLPAIAHGCNVKGVMGAGIALQIRRRWPEMYEEYRDLCFDGDGLDLGDIFPYQPARSEQVIYNLMTQDNPGPHADLHAIDKSVGRMLWHAQQLGIDTIGLPRIGCGIGGLEWESVELVLSYAAHRHPSVRLVIYTLP